MRCLSPRFVAGDCNAPTQQIGETIGAVPPSQDSGPLATSCLAAACAAGATLDIRGAEFNLRLRRRKYGRVRIATFLANFAKANWDGWIVACVLLQAHSVLADRCE